MRSEEFHTAVRVKFGIVEDVSLIFSDSDGDVATFPFSGYPSGIRFTLVTHKLRSLQHLVSPMSTNTLQQRLAEQQALRRNVLVRALPQHMGLLRHFSA